MDSSIDQNSKKRTIRQAAALLRSGKIVAFPTETVYGLGANATDDRAVAAIFAAKARPHFNPLIVHVPDREAALPLVHWTELADRLARRFWPGPLTLILRRLETCTVSRLASAGGETIALRAPAHPVAQALLREVTLPVAAPSANPAGRISPTTADHVRQELGGQVDMILDAGACPVGLESTVVDITTDCPLLLRPGGLVRQELEAAISMPLRSADDQQNATSDLRSPGRLTSHYAPRHPIRLNAKEVAADEALLAFGAEPLPGAAVTVNLSPSGNLIEAAANLFLMLHHLDRQKIRGIAVMPIPQCGLGEAICDRLKRAAAP